MQQAHSVRGCRLDQMVVEYLLVSLYHNHMDGVEEAYLHSFFRIHLDTFCTKPVIQKLFELELLLALHKLQL